MPFTLSHAAAALPLRHLLRGAAVSPALVIGCFIPDVPYFLPEPLCDINAHQLRGLVSFGIPCGWAIYALWFGLVREPAIALLPRQYAALLAISAPQHALLTRVWPTTVSLLAGATSHIVWDAFTHRRGFVVHALPALAQPMLHVGAYGLPTYLVLQHGSTLAGLLCLALYVRGRMRQTPCMSLAAEAAPRVAVTHKLALIAVLSLATAGLVWSTFSAADRPRFSAYSFVCCSISAAAAVVVAYALAWHVYRLRRVHLYRR